MKRNSAIVQPLTHCPSPQEHPYYSESPLSSRDSSPPRNTISGCDELMNFDLKRKHTFFTNNVCNVSHQLHKQLVKNRFKEHNQNSDQKNYFFLTANTTPNNDVKSWLCCPFTDPFPFLAIIGNFFLYRILQQNTSY